MIGSQRFRARQWLHPLLIHCNSEEDRTLLLLVAEARGLKETPSPWPPGFAWTPAREKVRLAVNDWIRKGEIFDGVIDFDKALRDPGSPSKLLPKWDCGDHLHPNDAGYCFMGDVAAEFLLGRGFS